MIKNTEHNLHVDMYSFDESAEAAQETYMTVCRAYGRILQRLRLPIVKGKTKYCIGNFHQEKMIANFAVRFYWQFYP